MTEARTYLRHVAHYHPDEVLDNEFFESILDTSRTWIDEHVGISERRFMGDYRGSFPVFEIGRRAVDRLVQMRGFELSEVDLIVSCSTTDDLAYPGPANMLAEHYNLRVPAFHLKNGCSSLLYGIEVVRGMLQLGSYRNALLVSGEPFTVHADYTDRTSSILFGDAGAAIVVSRDSGVFEIEDVALGGQGCAAAIHATAAGAKPERSVYEAHGSSAPLEAFFGEREPRWGRFEQRGRDVANFVLEVMPEEILAFLHRKGLCPSEVDYFIGHQSNLRMMEKLCDKIGIPAAKHISNIARRGNTASAGWATALSEALDEGRFQPGERLLVSAYGAGLAWGHLVARHV